MSSSMNKMVVVVLEGATFKDGGGGRDVLERATFTQFNRQCSLCGGSQLRVGRMGWL